jgi:hypothetical protein
MSKEAFELYEKALQEQHTRNEARRTLTRVTEARRNPHPAAVRWPFELLQNALDAGTRKDRSSVTIRLCQGPASVVFEHDGAPFTSTELAALLSGGSSKEFESEETTGRFGTGFLVTHVLSERTFLQGLLEVQSEYERFSLTLDRGGSEDAILANIGACNDAIRNAEPLGSLNGIPSARFEYHITDENTVSLGLGAFKQALPYLYLTRRKLGRVEFETKDTSEVWTAEEMLTDVLEDGTVEHRILHVTIDGTASRTLRVFRFAVAPDAAALALVESADDS